MESSVIDSTGYELRVLHAAADGVEPALLLSAPGKKAEYLLNVPDGFSRLALEHKTTPSGRLSCVLLTSLLPAATGGLGGLLLRLRHDGHGQLQMVGPRGTTAVVHSLRHVCRWQHPKILVSECHKNCPLPVFEDEHVVIVPLLDGDRATECPWCLYRVTASSIDTRQETGMDLSSQAQSRTGTECSRSVSSESSLSSEDTNCIGQEEVYSNSIEHNNFLPQRRKREEFLSFESPLGVDHTLFMHVRRKLASSRMDRMTSSGLLPPEPSSTQPPRNYSTLELDRRSPPTSCAQKGQLETVKNHFNTRDSSLGYSERGRVGPGKPFSGVRLLNGKDSPFSKSKPYDWLISNVQEVELPCVEEDSNPVFQRSPSADKQQNADLLDTNSSHSKLSSLLGYVCYLRKLSTAVLIVDCGSRNLNSLKVHHVLNCGQHPSGVVEESEALNFRRMHPIAAIVDLSPPSILQSLDYKLWIESLQSSGPHVVVKGGSTEFGFQSSLATLSKLNAIHSSIFPLPLNMNSCAKLPEAVAKKAAVCDNSNLEATLCMRLIFQRSSTSHSCTLVDYSMCPDKLSKVQEERIYMAHNPSDVEAFRPSSLFTCERLRSDSTNLSANPAAAAALTRNLQQQHQGTSSLISPLDIYHNLQNAMSTQPVAPNSCQKYFTTTSDRTSLPFLRHTSPSELESDFQLTFFGTGCAEPSKKRGSSGILLQVQGADGAILLEAGEGVAGQFTRRFGDIEAQTVISSLECVWLSHKHGDHVLGVLSILQERLKQKEPLVIIGPHKVGLWLSEVQNIRAAMGCPVPEFSFIRCQDLVVSGRFMADREHREQFDRVLERMHLQSLRLVRVFHCFDAYGVVVRGKAGWSVVFSGDTRPCKQLEQAGRGCSVLIHEATFEDELVEQAKLKRHSTVSEAIMAGTNMGAEHVILTHFSQRYPEMVAMCSSESQKVSVAFDGMVVPSCLLGSLSTLLPSIISACQKVDKTKASSEIGGITCDIRNFVPTDQASLFRNLSNQEGDDFTDAMNFSAVALNNSLASVKTVEIAKPKHVRWSRDASDDEVDVQQSDPDDEIVSIKWSSDSDEEQLSLAHIKPTGPVGSQGLQMRFVSKAGSHEAMGRFSAAKEARIKCTGPADSRELSGRPVTKAVSFETTEVFPELQKKQAFNNRSESRHCRGEEVGRKSDAKIRPKVVPMGPKGGSDCGQGGFGRSVNLILRAVSIGGGMDTGVEARKECSSITENVKERYKSKHLRWDHSDSDE